MTRYVSAETIHQCPRCQLLFAEREMAVSGLILSHNVNRCPKCNWNQDLLPYIIIPKLPSWKRSAK